MKLDLEGWFPGSGAYRELVSCSNLYRLPVQVTPDQIWANQEDNWTGKKYTQYTLLKSSQVDENLSSYVALAVPHLIVQCIL